MAKKSKGWIKVFQRGGIQDDVAKEMYVDMTTYILKNLTSTKMLNTLQIRIELRASKLKGDTQAFVESRVDGSQSSKEFRIVLDRDGDLARNLMSLGHELTHIYQICTGKYQMRYWKSDGQLHCRWNGAELGILDHIPYRERPWERQAFSVAETLTRAYVNYYDPDDKNGKERAEQFIQIAKKRMAEFEGGN